MSILKAIQRDCSREPFIKGEPPLGSLLIENSFGIGHPYGGRDVCGKCGVTLKKNAAPMTDDGKRFGARLSC